MEFVERKSDQDSAQIFSFSWSYREIKDLNSKHFTPILMERFFAPKHLSQASFCVFGATTRCLPQKIGNPYNNLLVNFNQAKKFNDSDEIKRNLPEMEGFSQVCWFMDSDAVQSSV